MRPLRFVGILLLLSTSAFAASIKESTSRKNPERFLTRLRRGYRVSRQNTDFTCQSAMDCRPSDLQNIPISTELVDCSSGVCTCNDCFMFDPENRKCFTCGDYPYFSNNGTCGTDVRQTQRTAFFYSFFLSATGAANFYIESYGLAVGQVIVLVVFLLSVVVVVCPCCICCGCVAKEGGIKGTCLFLVLFILSVIFVAVMGALIVSWWIGELTIFSNNERKTGSGCFPRPNL